MMVVMVDRQQRMEHVLDGEDAAKRGVAGHPSLGAGAQALTRKLSEAMLGLNGKERHAVLPPVAQPQSPQADAGNAAALPARSGLSSGRSGVVRPQARRTCSTSSGGKQPSPYGKQALAAAIMWQHASLSNKNAEGSATSDEDHPRLVPRRGAGPELRSSGWEIDEYLMRLLHAGGVDASQDMVFDNLTPPADGDAAGHADSSVAFPAGWNTTKPWFMGARVEGEGQEVVSPVQAPHVKPVMPPPPFLSQPWQGSRLGPLPPVGPLAQCPTKAREARKVVGDSSVLAAGSEGTVGTVTLSGASCPLGLLQSQQAGAAPGHPGLQTETPAQQQQQQEEDGCQRPEETPDKRQKVHGYRPVALAEANAMRGQPHAARDAGSLLSPPPPIKTSPQQDAQPDQAHSQRIAQAMTGKVGKLGMEVIRDTLMCQQALFTEQVEDLHRILAWQNVLMCCVGVSKEEVPPAQQAQRVKREDVSAEGTADPRTVLVSNLGNGSGGSQPSTDQGSWPQVQSETGRDASLPSGRLNSAQLALTSQQVQSVRHPANQGAAAHQGYPQNQCGAAVPSARQVQQAQQVLQSQQAQQAQHALQQGQAAAQELLMLSRQAPCKLLPRAKQFCQVGQTACQDPAGLSPNFRAGSGQLEAGPQIPTHVSPTSIAGQGVPVIPGQSGPAGAEDLMRAGSGHFMRAGSGQLAQNMRAMSGHFSGQLQEPMMPPQHNLGCAGSCAATFLDPQASDLQSLQENMAAQLQQRSRSYPPHHQQQPAGQGMSMAAQQQQQSAAAWYAEFLHHMSVQQQANLGAYPGMWPWTYQSQMAAQAMNAAAMGLHAAPGDAGMVWQGAHNAGSAYGLQQATAAQAAAQQQQQRQQAPDMQAQCNMSNATPPASVSEDAASQESARESHQEDSRSSM